MTTTTKPALGSHPPPPLFFFFFFFFQTEVKRKGSKKHLQRLSHRTCPSGHVMWVCGKEVCSASPPPPPPPLSLSLSLSLDFDLTLTLMIQDSGPFSHRTMFRFSKLKLIGLGGLGMVPIRLLLWQKLELATVVWDGAKQIVNVTI